MPVKIRLQRHGRTKRPFYIIVAADSRAPRDGKYIERLGSYDATTVPATIDINSDKALEWLHQGAQPTDTVRAILSYKGILYKKHLLRGVKKGALTAEQAEAKYQEYIGAKEEVVSTRIDQINKKLAEEKRKREEAENKKRSAKAEAAAAALAAAAPEEAIAETSTDEEAPVAELPAAEENAPVAEAPEAAGEEPAAPTE